MNTFEHCISLKVSRDDVTIPYCDVYVNNLDSGQNKQLNERINFVPYFTCCSSFAFPFVPLQRRGRFPPTLPHFSIKEKTKNNI
jgi:hypothetical protein